MFSSLFETIFPSKKDNGKRFETNYIGINQGKDYLNTYKQNINELKPSLTLIEQCNGQKGCSGSHMSGPKKIEAFSGMFGSSQANIKNEEDASHMTTLQDQLNRDLSDYATSQKLLMDKTANYINSTSTSASRNKNIFAILPETGNGNGQINPKWEGCYAGGKGMIYQDDLGNSATISSCKTRATDLGYSFFSLSNKNAQGSKCSVGNEKLGTTGDALKTMVSYSFKKNNGANIASLLKNGQIGTYKDNITNGLVTDLPGVNECDPEVGGLINTKNTVASYGANCSSIQPPAYALPYLN
jgi:hypothetical protein